MARSDEEDPFDVDGYDDGDTGAGGGAAGRVVPEFVRKVAVAGLGALFMTEEGLRSLAGQLKLPKEVLGYLLQQAEKTKDDVGRIASEEIRRFLQSDKLRREFITLLSQMTVEVKAEFRLVPSKSADGEGTDDVAPEVVVSEVKARSGKGRGKKS
ncbi:MAG TPA: hypothetical protein VK013_13450 [Myxococcaceae bacterium]|nr:hypothetical protein [Myxococcaceae bacterium]